MKTLRTTRRTDSSNASEGCRALAARHALATLCLVIVGAVVAIAGEYDSSKAAVGAGLFRSYCASCHGTNAEGQGDLAQYLTVKPADLTRIAERNGGSFDIETVQKVIDGRQKVKGHGRGEMPVWGDAFEVADGGNTAEETAERIEHLAHYLWSIQK